MKRNNKILIVLFFIIGVTVAATAQSIQVKIEKSTTENLIAGNHNIITDNRTIYNKNYYGLDSTQYELLKQLHQQIILSTEVISQKNKNCDSILPLLEHIGKLQNQIVQLKTTNDSILNLTLADSAVLATLNNEYLYLINNNFAFFWKDNPNIQINNPEQWVEIMTKYNKKEYTFYVNPLTNKKEGIQVDKNTVILFRHKDFYRQKIYFNDSLGERRIEELIEMKYAYYELLRQKKQFIEQPYLYFQKNRTLKMTEIINMAYSQICLKQLGNLLLKNTSAQNLFIDIITSENACGHKYKVLEVNLISGSAPFSQSIEPGSYKYCIKQVNASGKQIGKTISGDFDIDKCSTTSLSF